jgi:hypothetical protein
MSHPSYRPSQPSYPPAQPSHPTQPDYRRARASGTAAVGSSSVYSPTRQMPAGAVAREPVVPQYGSPMSGPPSGVPYDSAPPGLQPPGPRRGRGVPVLASLAVLLLLVGGVMTALYVTKSSQLGDTKQDVAAGEAKIKDLEQQLQKTKDDLAKARQDLTGTQNAQKETQRQKQVISKCLNLLGEAGAAAARNDRTTYDKVIKQVDKACDEAEKYLD